MSWASAILHGTIDFIGTSLPSILGYGLNRMQQKPGFKARLKMTSGSNFVVGRILERRAPLYLRAFHVDSENGFVPLTKSEKPQQVRYTVHLHDACFAARTKIRMADGSERAISEIQRGDLVYTRHGARQVLNIWHNGPSQKWLEVRYADRILIVTPNHPFWIQGIGWVQAEALLEVYAEVVENGEIQIRQKDVGIAKRFAIAKQDMDDREVCHPRLVTGRDRESNRGHTDCCSGSPQETQYPIATSQVSNSARSSENAGEEQLELERRNVQRAPDRDCSSAYQSSMEEIQERPDRRTWNTVRTVSESEATRSTSHLSLEGVPGEDLREEVYSVAVQRMSQRSRRSLHSACREALQVRRLPSVSQERFDLEVEGVHEYQAEGLVVHNSRAGRHFDVRLEYKGKAVSWAVPMKGKREDFLRMPRAGERWLAVRQPDHTIEYMGFEGIIPEGLGKGTVKIWSEGYADILKIEDGTVHVRFLDGKAQGDYVLVDTSRNGSSRLGLIIGKAVEPGELWSKPTYTKKEVEKLAMLEGQPVVAETKVDGASVQLEFRSPGTRTFSHRVSKRSGTLIEHTDRLAHLRDLKISELAGTKLRAEAWHPRGVNFLSGTMNSSIPRAREVQRQAGPVHLEVFDITHYKGQDVRNLPYSERRALYESVCNEVGSPYLKPVRQVHSGFERFYNQQVNLKEKPTDGVVVKGLAQAYDEKPWIKVKPSDLADCTVVGLSEGMGKHTGRLGALTVETPEGRRIQVGTGFSDWERKWIWNHRDQVEGEVARVSFHVRSGDRTHTGPRFDSWHPDKSESALKMYSEAMGVSPYQLKSAAGWRPK